MGSSAHQGPIVIAIDHPEEPLAASDAEMCELRWTLDEKAVCWVAWALRALDLGAAGGAANDPCIIRASPEGVLKLVTQDH
jgi:hypothetical protein